MFEWNDITPIWLEEGHDIWARVMYKEYFTTSKHWEDPKCYMAAPNGMSRCIRDEGHIGPHVNQHDSWNPHPNQWRMA